MQSEIMIQGDNLVGNQKNFEYNPNMNAASFSQESDDTAKLSSYKTEDLLPFVENLDFGQYELEHVNDPTIWPFVNAAEQNESAELKSDVFPDLAPHDMHDMNFDIHMETKNLEYSKLLDRIYVKVDKTLHFKISHKATELDLNLRLMMVFVDDISSPVKRCQNHMGVKHPYNDENKIKSIIHTENPNAEYVGNEDGKYVEDRLCVLIPLSKAVQPDEQNLVKQSIALNFVCQNSCLGRKQTAVIFYLENNKKVVLSKKVLNIKICSCPKRDKQKEEQKICKPKRTAMEAQLPPLEPPPGKIFKGLTDSSVLFSPPSSISPQNCGDDSPFNIIKTEPVGLNLIDPNESDVMTINIPRGMRRGIVECIQNYMAGEMMRQKVDYTAYLKDIERSML